MIRDFLAVGCELVIVGKLVGLVFSVYSMCAARDPGRFCLYIVFCSGKE